MIRFRWTLVAAWFAFLVVVASSAVAGTEESRCVDALTSLAEQNRELAEDLRRIHREIAALRSELDEPGMGDVVGGLGYIFGLFGAVFFVTARRKG